MRLLFPHPLFLGLIASALALTWPGIGAAQCPTSTSAGSEFRFAVPHHVAQNGWLIVMSDIDGVQVRVDLPLVCVPSLINTVVSRGNPAVIPVCAGAMQSCTGTSGLTQIRVRAINPVADVLHVVFKESQIVDQSDEAMMVLPVSRAGSFYRSFTYPGVTAPDLIRWTATAVDANTFINYIACDGTAAVSPVLNTGDTFQLFCDLTAVYCPATAVHDYTGDMISAADSHRFLLSSGAHCQPVPSDGLTGCDGLLEMQWPYVPDDVRYTDHLVTEFNKAFQPGRPGDLFRIVAMDNNFDVNIAGVTGVFPELIHGSNCTTPTHHFTNAGEWCEINIQGGGRISTQAGKKIQVAQYMKTNFFTKTGDPAMMLVVPTVRFTCSHRFFTFTGFLDMPPVTPPNNGSFINVIAPTAAIASTRIDGILLPAFCIGGLAPVAIPGTTPAHSWAKCRLPDPNPALYPIGQEHFVQGADATGNPVPIAVYVYGQLNYGAYAYPADLSFEGF